MDILLATQNKGKQAEFRDMLAGNGWQILTPADVNLGDFDVEESGETLLANSELKARAFAKASGLYALADDTGLMIDALDGRPGIYPARYGGPGLTPADRRQKVLGELEGVPEAERTARFECVVVVANPKTLACTSVTGVCKGRIAFADSGAGGFGYDAIFIPEGYSQTFAELDAEVKARLSHRGDAVRQILPILSHLIQE